MAGADLGTLTAKVSIDSSAFASTLARAQSFSGSMIGTFTKLGAAVGIGFGIEKVVGVIDSSLKAAESLQTSQRNVSQVFGSSAGVVENFSKRSVDALGLSESAALTASGR